MKTRLHMLARRAFEAQYPRCQYKGCSLRASEAERFVVAVFYSDSDLPSRPSPYKLYSVARDLAKAEELPCTPDSPYWIRGRK